MVQFCPKCQQWYDIYISVCPKCDIIMYNEEECNDSTESNKPLKIRSFSSIKLKKRLGWIFLIVGLICTPISGALFSGDNSALVPLLFYALHLTGFVLLIITRELCRDKKFTEPPNNPYTQCPYCKSKKVEKLTTIDRASSIIVVGAASGKIGKQWHCNNCKSDF